MEDDGISFQKPRSGGGFMGFVKKRIPFLQWAPEYDRTAAVADLVAGVTLGLTLVPQSIAYASLANLPVQYGLYSAYIGTMLYVLLGTVKEVSIGPTSLMALFTLQICKGLPLEFVVLLSFLSGCIVLCMGLLRLGFLVDLISPTVTSGFTSGTAVIIIVSQLKGLLGLSFSAENMVDNLELISQKWPEVRIPDVVLGLTCCAILLSLRKLKDVRVSPKRPALQKALWLLSIGRNALVVLAASTLAFCLHDPEEPLFKLSGKVKPGLPPVALPPFSATVNNRTLGALEMAQEMGSGLVMLPIVMVLANIAIAKAFTQGGRVDATQEMLTLGLVNIAGSFLHAMPTCGAFTRSAVSHSSGVRSPAAGLYSGIITLLALIFLTQHFYFIPKACLSAVLITAVVFMIDLSIVPRLWRQERAELLVLALTFSVSVLRTVELGAAAGALAGLAALLRPLLRPRARLAALKYAGGTVVIVRPEMCICYLNAERVARQVLAGAGAPGAAGAGAGEGALFVLLDCRQLSMVDFAGIQMLERLVEKLSLSQQKLVPFGAVPRVAERLRGARGLERRALAAPGAAAALAALRPSGEAAPGAAAALAALRPSGEAAPGAAAALAALRPSGEAAPGAAAALAALRPSGEAAPGAAAALAALRPSGEAAPGAAAALAALRPSGEAAPGAAAALAALRPSGEAAPGAAAALAALRPSGEAAPGAAAALAALRPSGEAAPLLPGEPDV